MKVIFIKDYEMICRSRWGWHTFKDKYGKVCGFRFLGVGLSWRDQ